MVGCNIRGPSRARTLTTAERALFIRRRKEIYEALYPETRHGGDRKSTRQIGDLNDNEDAERFSLNTAKSTGISERSIQLDAHRGATLGDDLEAIPVTPQKVTR